MKDERRSSHRTQWAAQFAVASELCKRNYQVALTLGNHPDADLMVISPDKAHFVVDVKGQYLPGWWLIRSRPVRSDLFYVLAFVPDNEPNQYFVLSHADALAISKQETKRLSEQRIRKGRSIEKIGLMSGFSWSAALKFKDKWQTLPK